VSVRGALALAATLRDRREEAFLYRELATLSRDAPLTETLEDLRWRGVDQDAFRAVVDELGMEELRFRVPRVPDLR
jgi:5'-3' exonuclease